MVVISDRDYDSAKVLEAIMATTKFKYHSAWADGLRNEGKLEGELVEARRSLLAVLERRSLTVTSAVQESVEACSDIDLLHTWLVNAVAAETLDDVFGADPDVQKMFQVDLETVLRTPEPALVAP